MPNAARPPQRVRRGATERQVEIARAAIENLRADELAGELTGRDGRVVLLIDVRSVDERGSGFIDGSISVPRGTIELSPDLGTDRTRRIVVYCDTGARSALAAATLYSMGFEDVAHLDGGLDAWRAASRPTTGVTGEVAPNPRIVATSQD